MKSGKAIPTILNYMTFMPHSVEADQTIDVAYNIMKEHDIRHLPVLVAGQISGVISDRDLKLAMSIRGVESKTTKVEEISTNDAFLVKPESKLDDVVKTMADKKIGSVLVVDHHKLVGIFTTNDALKALYELLESRLSH